MSPELQRILTTAVGPEATESGKIIEAISAARVGLTPHLHPSPLRKSMWLSDLTGGDVYLKLECLNPKGSFKVRGAFTAISRRLEAFREKGGTGSLKVCAASAGNHAQGVALAAKWLGCEAHIFLPRRTPLIKRESTEQLGAKVYLAGDVLEDAFEAALAFSESDGAEFLHAFNDFDIIAGQGTCALEIFDQLQEYNEESFNTFLCAIGGGGLLSGCGYVIRNRVPDARIIGVEQKNFDSAATSLEKHEHLPVSQQGLSTIADGIAVRMIGNLNYRYLSAVVDKVALVNDESIVGAVLGLCENEHIVVEGAGAVAVAEILRHPSKFASRKTVACVSGGNIDPQLLTRVVARGLNVTGRVLNLRARIGDRPGHLAGLLEQIAKLEVNVLEVFHDRTYSQVTVGDVGVELALETKNFEHQYELMERLEELGYQPKIP